MQSVAVGQKYFVYLYHKRLWAPYHVASLRRSLNPFRVNNLSNYIVARNNGNKMRISLALAVFLLYTKKWLDQTRYAASYLKTQPI